MRDLGGAARRVAPPLSWASGHQAEDALCRSAGEAEEHEDRSTEPDEFLVAKPADRLAELGARHSRDLVDHETARIPQPVHLVWIDSKAKQWGIGLIRRERADRDRVRPVEAIVLDDRDGSRFADVSSPGGRSPDLPALQSWSTLAASMNA